QIDRANRSHAAALDSEGAIADARVRKEAALEQLNHIPTIRQSVADRIHFAYDQQKRAQDAAVYRDEIDKIRRQLDLLEAKAELRRRQAELEKEARGGPTEERERSNPTPDEEADILRWFGKVPNFVRNAEKAKEEIIKNAGGEENISESVRAICDTIDA